MSDPLNRREEKQAGAQRELWYYSQQPIKSSRSLDFEAIIGVCEKGCPMAKQEPSVDQWLREAKADPAAAQCGMFLTHNGVVRITPKAQVREGVEGLGDVVAVEFSYDAEGLAAAEAEALTWPGVYYVRTWLNEGRCEVGDSLMYVLIGADIRPNCIEALQKLVGHIKNELVVEKEIFA